MHELWCQKIFTARGRIVSFKRACHWNLWLLETFKNMTGGHVVSAILSSQCQTLIYVMWSIQKDSSNIYWIKLKNCEKLDDFLTSIPILLFLIHSISSHHKPLRYYIVGTKYTCTQTTFIKGKWRKKKGKTMVDPDLEEIWEQIFLLVTYRNYCHYDDGSPRMGRSES